MLLVKGVEGMYSIGTEEYIRRVVEDYSPMLLRLAMTRSLSTAEIGRAHV